MQNIDFSQIQSHDGSQNKGFEELVCQLACLSKPENAKEFIRKDGAGGDAGVECYWKLQDGSEQAWQAKYFLKPLGSSQWNQISKSVKSALNKHPDLTKYYICLPKDRNDSRRSSTQDRQITSELDKWNQYVEKWQAIAATKSMQVEFEYWGEHEILLMLQRDTCDFAGIAKYWFGTPTPRPTDILPYRYLPTDLVDQEIKLETNLTFVRPQAAELARRLKEPRRFIQVVSGARQVGKTTLALQVADQSKLPYHFASADEPTLRGNEWIESQWEEARLLATSSKSKGALLILDEVQKISHWAEMVKYLWDEDTRKKTVVKTVLLSSAPLLIGYGLTESLAGRFEILHMPHWSFSEMQEAFGWDLNQYLFYGAYPGAAPLIEQPLRWSRYIIDSLIETTVARDVLLLSRVDKPALLRRLFELGCAYSGQILSYTKMIGQLQDAGNTTTLAHYLDLLSGAGVLTGLHKYAGDTARRRASSPKFQVFNTALITALSDMTLAEALADREFWGRLTESAVGAHLINASAGGACEVFYWRERNREVDFVLRKGKKLVAIEVKSGRTTTSLPGLESFSKSFKPDRRLIVGSGGISLERFLSTPVEYWISQATV